VTDGSSAWVVDLIFLSQSKPNKVFYITSTLSDYIHIQILNKDSVSFSTPNAYLLMDVVKTQSDVDIQMTDYMMIHYSLRYLNMITKAAQLSKVVLISFSKEDPAVFEYPIEGIGHKRFYLAPKKKMI